MKRKKKMLVVTLSAADAVALGAVIPESSDVHVCRYGDALGDSTFDEARLLVGKAWTLPEPRLSAWWEAEVVPRLAGYVEP